ncbi:MAG: hypothetical protein ACD_23C00473G0003 [uncultured bacterium]|nr:MAG: hypothetical protein ACD_23C00473G0003 [uncultured bacterium]
MPSYGFKLVFPNSEDLTSAGFGKVAHVPAIFDSAPGYARLPSRFLIDRALGVWDPASRGTKLNPHPPSRISIKNFGYWLCNALEWAEVRGIDLVTCDYTTVLLGRYQQEMLKGIWSQSGTPLAAQTVNARVDLALEFQTWCADKGFRDPFLVPTQIRTYFAGSHSNSKSHEAKTVTSRKGKVRANKHTLAFPADEEITSWRKRVYAQPILGATQGLMVDHILETAIRREELSAWRVDTLPLDRNDWQIVNPHQPEEKQLVALMIDKGTKGREFYVDEHGDKIGPRGNIQVPLTLCKRIDEYRDTERKFALKHVTRGVRDLGKAKRLIDKTVHLYLNPKTGTRYTGDQIYRFWKKAGGPKYWSPHLGRDWWACQHLWQEMREYTALIKQVQGLNTLDGEHPLMRSLKDTVVQVIQLEIQPQLRHVSSATTEIYLQWLFNQLRVPLNLTRMWHEHEKMGT